MRFLHLSSFNRFLRTVASDDANLACHWVGVTFIWCVLFYLASYQQILRRTSRGIGLEIIKQLTSITTHIVFAGCRNPRYATDLQALTKDAKGTLHIVALDVNDEQSVQQAAKAVKSILGDQGLDYIVNNAATVSPPIATLN